MHYQVAPYEEAKLIRCTSGSIYDVIVDLRPDSATFRDFFGLLLTADSSQPPLTAYSSLLPTECFTSPKASPTVS